MFVWHAAVEPEYRKLLAAIADCGVDLLAIVPTAWTEGGKLLKVRSMASDKGCRIEALAALGRDRVKRFFYPNIPRLASLLRSFSPDVLHVFEEPYSLCTFEILLLKKLVASKARVVIHTFENLPTDHGVPFAASERFCFKHADAFISVPEEGINVLRSKGYRGPIHCIPIGLDANKFYRRNNPFDDLAFLEADLLNALRADTFKIAYVGRLVPEKGVDLLAEAVASLRAKGMDLVLFIVGAGQWKRDLERLVEQKGIGKQTFFLAPLQSSALSAFLSCMNTLVLPSRSTGRWKEQFGRVLIEAMACGVPVVGSSSGEIPNVIGEGGLIFKEGDVEDLVARLSLLAGDDVLRKRLAAKGRARVLERFTHEKVADGIVSCYKEILREAVHHTSADEALRV